MDFDTRSEKINFSKTNLRQALKESIGKFKEEFDKSHEEEKLDDNMIPGQMERLVSSRTSE